MNLAVERPARRVRRLRPAQAGVGHVVEGGNEAGGERAVGLRGDQPCFLITDLPMLAPVSARGCRARVDNGHHRAVGFGHDLRRAVGRQGPHYQRTGCGARAASTRAWCSVKVRTRAAGTRTP